MACRKPFAAAPHRRPGFTASLASSARSLPTPDPNPDSCALYPSGVPFAARLCLIVPHVINSPLPLELSNLIRHGDKVRAAFYAIRDATCDIAVESRNLKNQIHLQRAYWSNRTRRVLGGRRG